MITVRTVEEKDRQGWGQLFQGYAEFYKTRISEETIQEVWGWLMDADNKFYGFISVSEDGRYLGFAHYRPCPRSLSGGEICFLDDFYVAPCERGLGVADKIFDKLKEVSIDNKWQSLRWLTQELNYRGRGFYDKYAKGPSGFIMYQIKFS